MCVYVFVMLVASEFRHISLSRCARRALKVLLLIGRNNDTMLFLLTNYNFR